MTETEKAYVAGYLEARNFRPHYSKGTYQIVTHCSAKHSHYIGKVAQMIGARLYEGPNASFGESFEHDGRPAVYTDNKGTKLTLWMPGLKAQRLILDIYKYLDPYTIHRFKALLEHRFLTPLEIRQKAGRTKYKRHDLSQYQWRKEQSGNPSGRRKNVLG